MYTLSFNRTCKQLGSTGLACTKSSSLYRFCLCLLTAQFWTYEEYEHVINWSGLRFEHGNLQYGSLYDCGEIRAKLAMVWIHWIRLPFSTLFAFCWRLQQMCMNNVWRRKLAFTVMWKLKATKCYMSRQAKRYIMCTAQHECPTDCCIFRFIIDGSNCMRYNYLKQKKSVNPFFKKKTYR